MKIKFFLFLPILLFSFSNYSFSKTPDYIKDNGVKNNDEQNFLDYYNNHLIPFIDSEEFVSRGLFIDILVNALEKRAGRTFQIAKSSAFTDVIGRSYVDSILKVEPLKYKDKANKEHYIISRQDDGLFDYDDKIERVEALAFTVRIYENFAGKKELSYSNSPYSFIDLPSDKTNWQFSLLQRAYQNGFTTGYSKSSSNICSNTKNNYSSAKRCFLPGKFVKAIEAVAFVEKLIDYLDPSTNGKFEVKSLELNNSDLQAKFRKPDGTIFNLDLALASIKYPILPNGNIPDNMPIALFLHGQHRTCKKNVDSCPKSDVVKNHKGYDYILERLASYGVFSISISSNEINNATGTWNYKARGFLILTYLDLLRQWNNNKRLMNFEDTTSSSKFVGKLDLSKIALSGHSRGGEGVVSAAKQNQERSNLKDAAETSIHEPHSIMAINAIAPTDQSTIPVISQNIPYFLLIGSRDGDVKDMQGFRTYDRISDTKMISWVYGANHNYFNSTWVTDTINYQKSTCVLDKDRKIQSRTAISEPYTTDDGVFISYSINIFRDSDNWFVCGHTVSLLDNESKLSIDEQKNIANTSITAFFLWKLKGIEYKKLFSGQHTPSGLKNLKDSIYWTYQHRDYDSFGNKEFLIINDFESSPTLKNKSIKWKHFKDDDKFDYPTGYKNKQFVHDTFGLEFPSNEKYEYESTSEINLKSYNYINIRGGKFVLNTPVFAKGVGFEFIIKLTDSNSESSEIMFPNKFTSQTKIPHPYQRKRIGVVIDEINSQFVLVGMRMPLHAFSSNNNNIDLEKVKSISVRINTPFEGVNVTIGLDDIIFEK